MSLWLRIMFEREIQSAIESRGYADVIYCSVERRNQNEVEEDEKMDRGPQGGISKGLQTSDQSADLSLPPL